MPPKYDNTRQQSWRKTYLFKKNCDENITMAKNFMSTKTKNQNTYCSHDETISTTGKYFFQKIFIVGL